MRGFWWKLPWLRTFGEARKGFVEALAVVGAGSLILSFSLDEIWPEPSPATLNSLAQVGATLLVAYAVEIAWLIKASRDRSRRERETRLGRLSGFGGCGLIAIGVALVLAERAAAGRHELLDVVGVAWVSWSLLFLGAAVVMQPMLVHEWMDDGKRHRNRRIPRPPIRSRR